MDKPNKQRFTFEWLEGGYNHVEAESLDDAIWLGNAMGNGVHDTLTVNPDKCWPDPDGSIMERYRKQHEGTDI